MAHRLIPYCASVLIAATLGVTTAAPAPAALINVWSNPSAEAGIAGAGAEGSDAAGMSVSQQQADAWRGRCSFELRFTAGASGEAALVFGASNIPVVNVSADQVVFFRVAGKISEGATGTALELRSRWLDDAGHLISETPALCYVHPESHHPWIVLDGWDTAPAGAARVALALYAVHAAGVTVLRADGVQITLDPARFVGYVDGDEPGCEWMGAKGMSVSRRLEAMVNLIPNPSFEQGIAEWRSGAGAGGSVRVLERSESWASAGRASLHLKATASSQRNTYVAMVSQPIPVVGGQEYTLRAAVNITKLPAGGRVGLVLGWLDSTGAYLFTASMSDQAAVSTPGVHQLAVTKPAPRDAATAVAVVGSVGGVAGDYDIRADAFSLIADSGAPPTRPFWVGFNDQLLNNGPLTCEQDVAHDVQLGVNAVRLPVNLFKNDLYKQVWPSADAPINLDPVAPTFDAFFHAGVRLLLLSPITPWMLKDGRIDPSHYADVGKLSAAFIRRWPRIIAVEAHNEPNSRQFWPPAADPVLFVRYLEAVYRTVKAADPAMSVLAPSCNAPLTKNSNMSLADYMKAFYATGGGRWCDALSIHPYPFGASSGAGIGKSRDFWAAWGDECMRQLREVRDAFHDSAKPIWITELGSPTTTPVHPLELIVKPVTEDQQARSTALLYDWARRQGDVQAIIYHTNAEKLKHPEGDFGLFEPDGRLKPAFLSLQQELHRTPPPYFDGDTPGCRWFGQPGASPSLQPVAQKVTAD